jgi:chorismate mutase/prephenate dehydratase
MELSELRKEIDSIDDQLVKLFCQRMDVAARVAEYKKENDLPIYHPAREREKLRDVSEKAGSEMADYARILYATLFELSRSYQEKKLGEHHDLRTTG